MKCLMCLTLVSIDNGEDDEGRATCACGCTTDDPDYDDPRYYD